MTVPFATADDVAARWRPLSPDEEQLADVLASDASALIRARFPGIDTSQVDPTILTMVVAGMVKRAMIAPEDGVSQESQTTGPYSHSQSFSNPMRNVFLTAADHVLILGYQPKGGTFKYRNTTSAVSPAWQTVYGS